MYSLRSMAVLSSRAHERAGRTSGVAAKFAREARENERRSREKKKNRLPGFEGFLTAAPFTSVAPAPISSRFFCPRPPLLLSNQNRHATQASKCRSQDSGQESFRVFNTLMAAN